MNIVFVNEFSGYVGGVEQNVLNCARQLRRRGHRCHLLYYRRAREDQVYASCFDSVHAWPGAGGLRALFQELKADLGYLHRIPSAEPFLRLTIPVLRMVHDHDLCCPRRHKYDAYLGRPCNRKAGLGCWLDLAFLEKRDGKLGFKNLFRHARELELNKHLDGLVVASRAMRDELLTNGFDDHKIVCLPPAVPDDVKAPLAVDRPRPATVLFVGQMLRGKGPDLLLHALARVRTKFRAVLVGDGNWKEEMTRLSSRLGLDDRVRFSGWVDHSQLRQLYREARVVAVPSRWPEPFGMVGLEAMHHSCPVVAYSLGGIPDWLEDGVTGHLVPPGSVSGFAQALEHLLLDRRTAKKMGQAGLARARRLFDFNNYIDGLEQLFQAHLCQQTRKEAIYA